MADGFERFSEKAKRVMATAQKEAERFNHNYIGTEHILLGLVRETDGVAARVLSNLGIELHKVRLAVELIIGRGTRSAPGEIGLTLRAKKVIKLAVDEARQLNHHYIGTEHLLIGLMREGEGVAAGVLESLGVNLEKARDETSRILATSTPEQEMADMESFLKDTIAFAREEVDALKQQRERIDQDLRRKTKEVAALVRVLNHFFPKESTE